MEQVRTLLHNFCIAELERVILFLKHIIRIEICHVDADGRRQVVGIKLSSNGLCQNGSQDRKLFDKTKTFVQLLVSTGKIAPVTLFTYTMAFCGYLWWHHLVCIAFTVTSYFTSSESLFYYWCVLINISNGQLFVINAFTIAKHAETSSLSAPSTCSDIIKCSCLLMQKLWIFGVVLSRLIPKPVAPKIDDFGWDIWRHKLDAYFWGRRISC